MKKVLALVAVVSLMAAATVAGAASIKNSKHDLSSGSTGATIKGDTNQLCVFCHTPHNAVQDGYPLWNRNNPAGTGFDLYSSGNMKNSYKTGTGNFASDGFTSNSVSLYCMSCHDGVTSVGAVKNYPVDKPSSITISGAGQAAGVLTTSNGNLGTNLRDDHPVNFNVSAINPTNIGEVTGNTMKTNTGDVTNGFPLFNSARGTTSLECASCHAVHNPADEPFLRTTMTGSKLCLGCHYK